MLTNIHITNTFPNIPLVRHNLFSGFDNEVTRMHPPFQWQHSCHPELQCLQRPIRNFQWNITPHAHNNALCVKIVMAGSRVIYKQLFIKARPIKTRALAYCIITSSSGTYCYGIYLGGACVFLLMNVSSLSRSRYDIVRMMYCDGYLWFILERILSRKISWYMFRKK